MPMLSGQFLHRFQICNLFFAATNNYRDNILRVFKVFIYFYTEVVTGASKKNPEPQHVRYPDLHVRAESTG